MKKLIIILFLPFFGFAQSFDSTVNQSVQKVNQDSIQKYLQEFENLGIKEVGTTALNNTASWIESYYTSWGYIVKRDTFYFGGKELYNLLVEKTGIKNPNEFIIVDGHYDSKAGPGVNDNGSGTTIILELARLLKNKDVNTSVRFIHFSGEEGGLFGSQHYVTNTLKESTSEIKLVLNIDEVGGVTGQLNNTVVCEYDNSFPTVANAKSVLITDTLANLTELYSSLKTTKAVAYSSDYMPFQAKEYVITGYFEANETPYAHTINDSLKYMDIAYVTELTKATVGSVLYFAKQGSITTGFDYDKKESESIIYDNFEIQIPNYSGFVTIISNSGKTLFKGIIAREGVINISTYPTGIYLLRYGSRSVKFLKL